MDEEIKTWNANLAILLERLKRADTAPEVVIHLFRNCVIKSVEILKEIHLLESAFEGQSFKSERTAIYELLDTLFIQSGVKGQYKLLTHDVKPNVMVQRKMPRGFKARLVGILI